MSSYYYITYHHHHHYPHHLQSLTKKMKMTTTTTIPIVKRFAMFLKIKEARKRDGVNILQEIQKKTKTKLFN